MEGNKKKRRTDTNKYIKIDCAKKCCSICGKPMDTEHVLGKNPVVGIICDFCHSKLPHCVKEKPDGITIQAMRQLISNEVNALRRLRGGQRKFSYKNLGYYRESQLLLFSEVHIPLENVHEIYTYAVPKKELKGGEGYIMDVYCKVCLNNPKIYLLDWIGHEVFLYKDGPFGEQKPWKWFYTYLVTEGIRRKEEEERREERNKRQEDKIARMSENALHDAMVLFMLPKGVPFTEDELKTRYRRLQRAFHPDNGGEDVAASQKINAAYAILKKEIGR